MLLLRKLKRALSALLAVLVIIIIVLAVVAGVEAFLRTDTTVTSTTTSVASSVAASVSTSIAMSFTTSIATSTSVSTFVSASVSTVTEGSASINSTVLLAAEAECQAPGVTNCLTIESTISAANWTSSLLPAFYAEFPWANGKVTENTPSSTTFATSVEAAYNNHAVTADVLTGSPSIFFPVIQSGAVANYMSNMIAQLGYNASTYGPQYATASIEPTVLLYNPTYLRIHDIPIPTTWQNLTNPIYKGLITMQNPSMLASSGLELYWLSYNLGYTNTTWTSLMKGIAANDPIITTDPTISTADVYNGQAAIGVGIVYDDFTSVINNVTSGASPSNLAIDEQGQFAISPVSPLLVGVANGAPHQAMGRLMEDWLLSPPGQYALGLTAQVPLYQPIAFQLNELPPGLTIVNAVQDPAVETDSASWATLFNNLGL